MNPRRNVAILDVETVPCADALALSTRRSRGGHARTSLHQLVSVCVLTACESESGFSDVELRAFASPEQAERDMIGYTDLLLPDPAEENSVLVTYNGSHDLRILQHRACAIWMFDVPRLSGWCSNSVGEHVDLIDNPSCADLPRWSLPDTCAGLGFAIRRGLSGRSVHRLHAEGHYRAVLEHNMLDVVGTFLVYAYGRSFRTGCDKYVVTAWDAVGRATAGMGNVDPNTQSIADHHLVARSRTLLTHRAGTSP